MDDDFFSDDEAFEALGESELAALEESAIQSTQAQSQRQRLQPQLHTDAGLVIPATRYNQSRHTQQQPNQWQQATTTSKYPQTNNTDFGPTTVPTIRAVTLQTPQLGNVYINHRQPALAAPAEYNRYDETTELWGTSGPQVPRQEGQNGVAFEPEEGDDEADYHTNDFDEFFAVEDVTPRRGWDWDNQEQDQHLESLRAKIIDLEGKLKSYQQDLQTVQSNYLAKNGEVAIVRNNMVKANREHEQFVHSIQAMHKEEREKYEQELRMVKEEIEKLRTQNMFLANDFEEVLRKNKSLEKNGNDDLGKIARQSSPMTTPKKKKFMPHRDGFDDDEIVITSPNLKSRVITPSKKRKRPSLESPKGSLPLSQSRGAPAIEGARNLYVVDEEILQRLWHDDRRFMLLELLEAHRSELGDSRTLETLSRYSLPSSPEMTLSSLLIDNITSSHTASAKSGFSAAVCKSLLCIWRKLLDERFWEPLRFILELIYFIVMWDHSSTLAILDDAVDLIQRTVDINAIARVKRDLDALVPEIEVNQCLVLLESIGFGAMVEEQSLKRFWKLIRVDFVLMMLNPSQPLNDILSMTSMLCTSVFGDSFGPQVSNEANQHQNESHILDAVSRLLLEVPELNTSEQATRRSKVITLRKELLQFLGCLLATQTGSRLLVNHPTALSRLARRISDELEEVYDFRGDVDSSVSFVNAAVRLLHSILITHPDIQLGTKLTGGATHKHLVAMTRLAFSQGILQEAGIEEEVVEYAHNILEMSVTPQEGEVLQGLFTSPPVR